MDKKRQDPCEESCYNATYLHNGRRGSKKNLLVLRDSQKHMLLMWHIDSDILFFHYGFHYISLKIVLVSFERNSCGCLFDMIVESKLSVFCARCILFGNCAVGGDRIKVIRLKNVRYLMHAYYRFNIFWSYTGFVATNTKLILITLIKINLFFMGKRIHKINKSPITCMGASFPLHRKCMKLCGNNILVSCFNLLVCFEFAIMSVSNTPLVLVTPIGSVCALHISNPEYFYIFLATDPQYFKLVFCLIIHANNNCRNCNQIVRIMYIKHRRNRAYTILHRDLSRCKIINDYFTNTHELHKVVHFTFVACVLGYTCGMRSSQCCPVV